MRAVIQRVSQARVTVEGEVTGAIEKGLLVLLGVGHDDTEAGVRALAAKIAKLRIFGDEAGKMNLSVQDVGGGVLAVSQFTLLAVTRRGNRPSFTGAAPPEKATCRALLRPPLAAKVTRPLARVAMLMPMKPERAAQSAPMRKVNATYTFSTRARKTAKGRAVNPITRYSRRMKVVAPIWIAREMVVISGGPASFFRVLRAR